MSYQGKYIPIPGFNGGYCGNLPASSLGLNQAADLDNLTVSPDGKSFRIRYGSKAQGTPDNTANITSLGMLYLSAGNIYIGAICGANFYTNEPSVNGTYASRTGALTITADSYWSFVNFNDLMIGFGSKVGGSVNAPFKWTGSGDATALGGTPPSATGCFTANNRVFAYNTVAAPSSIFWSILGNAEDWTGTGSGSAVVGSLADGEEVKAAAVVSTNTALIFKSNSIHQMVLTASPFPIYPLFNSIGCVGKYAVVEVDGKVYFVSNNRRMFATDGEAIQEFPNTADNLWDSISDASLPLVKGARIKQTDHDWIVWTANTANGRIAIIWDLINKCWLRCTTGYDTIYSNIVRNRFDNFYYAGTVSGSGTVVDGITFGQGGVYQIDTSTRLYDQSSVYAGTISAYWRSGWINQGSPDLIVQPRKMNIQFKTDAGETITINYGYDFNSDQRSATISQTATGSESESSKFVHLTGRGNFFQFKVSSSSSQASANDLRIYGITLGGKNYGQKRITAS